MFGEVVPEGYADFVFVQWTSFTNDSKGHMDKTSCCLTFNAISTVTNTVLQLVLWKLIQKFQY